MSDVFARRFESQYAGAVACGHYMEIGDVIAYTPDDELVCAECARLDESENGADDLYEWATSRKD